MTEILALVALIEFLTTAYLLIKNTEMAKDLEFFHLDKVQKIEVFKNEDLLHRSVLEENSFVEFTISKDRKTLALILKSNSQETEINDV